jgi:hypothetical protein
MRLFVIFVSIKMSLSKMRRCRRAFRGSEKSNPGGGILISEDIVE